ncbi:hypothetical protein SteCoe_26408 [Stentor coeruleus]|uniref:Kinesin motor domain-containing protein n=1 Tax=Stentor coeruleus TaxID=5963 RepID=A0A1R2BCX4_9CILI|nr:hypothetical protein SteCoe_26408 [Stentor coeruleus]
MEKKFFIYLRFKPTENPEKRLITEIAQCPLDYIFTPTASQEEVHTKFKYIADDLVVGKNACIIIIGSPNSGKRYSVFGKFPAENGIITRVTEELLQHDINNHYKLFFAVSDINGAPLIFPKKQSNTQVQLRFESNLLEISHELASRSIAENAVIYKLVVRDIQSTKESSLTVIQLSDAPSNLIAFGNLIKDSSIETANMSKISKILFRSTENVGKVAVMFTCKEEKKDLEKVKQVFLDKPFLETQSDEITENCLDSESDQYKKRISILEMELQQTKEKLAEAEKKAHEYYECYHKTLLLINKDSAQNVFLNSQNESLIRQIRKETNILQSLEAKYQGLIDTCTKSHESTHIEFDSLVDSMLKSENSMDMNATDTLNLGISQVKLTLQPDPLMFSPYSTEIKQALEGNSELSKEIQLLQLKNQLIEASVINANMSRMLSSFDWKFAMIKHRYEMKRLLSKQQQERIKSLEEMLEYLHNSFEALKRANLGTRDNEIDKLFDKYCYKAIVDSQRQAAEYKKSIQNIEQKVSESHRRESQKWMELLNEHKENYEKELRRKQGEVIRLNELLGKWINRYMELQENLTMSDKPLSIVYYNQIQQMIHDTISSPSIKVPDKQMTPKAKSQTTPQKFGIISGDIHPPI